MAVRKTTDDVVQLEVVATIRAPHRMNGVEAVEFYKKVNEVTDLCHSGGGDIPDDRFTLELILTGRG